MNVLSRNRRIAIFLLIVVSALTALMPVFGIASEAKAGPYTVSVRTDPPVIPVGNAKFIVGVTDASGKPVEGAKVTTFARMPGMNMGEREMNAAPLAGQPGTYSSPAIFSMAGLYEVTVSVTGHHGSGSAVIQMRTGQNTGADGGGFSVLTILPWLALAALAVFVIVQMKKTGQRFNGRSLLNRTAVGGVLLLAAILAFSVYAVNNWRRKGAMTPIESQAMEMNTPAPPGVVPVRLATVARGSLSSTVRYTGQAAGSVAVDINPRVSGAITWMPFYVGSKVSKGQMLARLDTSQIDPQVAERQAMVTEKQQGVDVAATEYRQMLEETNTSRADYAAKLGMREEAQAMLEAAKQEREAAASEVEAMRTGVTTAQAEVSAMQASAEYQRADFERMAELFKRGAVSKDEYQRAQSMLSEAEAKVRQTQSMVREAQAKVATAQAGVRKADAMVSAAQKRIRQANAEVFAAEAEIRAKQAAAEVARKRIGQEQSGVRQAVAGLGSMMTARGYSEIRSTVDGIVTERLISPGTVVSPGQAILRVAQTNPIRLQANVPETDLARVQVGATVSVSKRGQKGPSLVAKVTSVSPNIDPSARTGVVEALVPNANGKFLPGEYLTMDITVGENRNVLSIPSQAIVHEPLHENNDVSFVWVAEPSGDDYTVRRTEVTLGDDNGKASVVISGLEEGQLVVVEGNENLHEGDTVTTPKAALTVETSGPVVEITDRGYQPASISANVGEPLDITFVRRSNQTCGTEVVFPDYGIEKELPLNKPVVVRLTPKKPGEFRFTCGMGMLDGKVVAK